MPLEWEALYSARQREKAGQVAHEALKAYQDMPDDPNVLRIVGRLATAAAFTRDYELARVMSDRALAGAERLGMPEVAAQMLLMKGSVAMFQGRLWEATALTEGGRRLAEQHGLSTLASRSNSALANILALDDPRATAMVEREIVENARRTGLREQETVTDRQHGRGPPANGRLGLDRRRAGAGDPRRGPQRQRPPARGGPHGVPRAPRRGRHRGGGRARGEARGSQGPRRLDVVP